MSSLDQKQTANVFAYKWQRTSSYESDAFLARNREYIIKRYGDVQNAGWWSDYGVRPRLLDAGCGGGVAAIGLLGSRLHNIEYVGVDISDAYLVAQERFHKHGYAGNFIQADFTALPPETGAFDIILAEGVLHHADSTEGAFKALVNHLSPGGRFMFYVYAKKGPIREFTDDYIREKLHNMTPEDAWDSLASITQLGKFLAELNIELDLPDGIDVLEIPAGKINLQRLFYWHIFKCYHRADWSLEEMQHVNFDWYAPKNCHRHTKEEITRWCADSGLGIERLDEEEAGFTVIAQR